MTAAKAFRYVVEETQSALGRPLDRMEIRLMAAFFNSGRIYEGGPVKYPANERDAMCDALVRSLKEPGDSCHD